MSAVRSPSEQLLDLVLYAPVGMLRGATTLPDATRRGREQCEPQVNLAKFVGKFAVQQGTHLVRLEITKWLAQATGAPRDGTIASVVHRSEEGHHAPPSTTRAPVAPVAPIEQVIAVRHEAPPSADLAIPEYDALAASQVIPRLAALSPTELDAVRGYEAAHRGRRTILARIGQIQGL